MTEIKLKMNSDLIGALASTLCTIHCLATPFIFLASTCARDCCNGAPTWWLWIDYGFLIISFFAVYQSTKTTSKYWIKPALWICWGLYLPSYILSKTHNYFCQIILNT